MESCTISYKQKLEEMEIPWQWEENYKMILKYFVVPKPNEWLKQWKPSKRDKKSLSERTPVGHI